MTAPLRAVPAELLTVTEVADMLRLGVSTVYELCHRGELEGHRIGVGGRDRRGAVRITRRSITALLERSRLGPRVSR